MTTTTAEVFEKYQVRKTKKQKIAFAKYVESVAYEHGYSFKVEKGFFGDRNLVVGDPDSAKVVYTAHYDTCPRLPFPNFITPKNFFIYLLYQILICVGFLIVAFALGFLAGIACAFINVSEEAVRWVALLVYWVFLFLIVAGPANKHTANDNTSGVTTLLDIMSALPNEDKQKVAFVFFDLEESGLLGSSVFAVKHRKPMKNTLLINFDCVSDGEYMLFTLRKKARVYKELLEKAFEKDENVQVEVATKGIFYPSDQMNFPVGVGVAALKKSKRFNLLYMDRIHTNKDTVYREENINFLKNGALKLLQLM